MRDADGDDSFVEIVVKVPTGSKDEAYDGYALAEDYTIKAEAKAAKEKEAADKKAAKIKRDEAKRKQLAESKAKAQRITPRGSYGSFFFYQTNFPPGACKI